jgi:hypothetical protein
VFVLMDQQYSYSMMECRTTCKRSDYWASFSYETRTVRVHTDNGLIMERVGAIHERFPSCGAI